MNTSSTIRQIISEIFGINISDIKDTDHFSDNLGIDSLDFYELINEIEKEFAIQIPDEDYKKVQTIETMIGYVQEKLSYRTIKS